MRDSKEKIKGEDKMAVKTVDPEVAAKDRNGSHFKRRNGDGFGI